MRPLGGMIAMLAFALAAGTAEAAGRFALVLSAEKYEHVRPLANADDDADLVAETLEALGFTVVRESNRDLRRMRRALDDFREDAAGADVALVYFAGHGVEIAGDNRLLPVDADVASLEALKASTLPLVEVRAAAAEAAETVLIVLDACRDDPFGTGGSDGRSARPLAADVKDGATPGFGRVGRSENTLFAFSAAPGETASDGTDGHSPFSAALAEHLSADGLEIRSVLTLVQQEVYERSAGRQLPYVESGLPRLFFAAETGTLAERERLLLAMADVTPDMRQEVERIASERSMPLGPLYGALISADLRTLAPEERDRKLAEAADAFVATRDDLRRLASDDPQVTRLRTQAEEKLALGAFEEARQLLSDAASIDASSSEALAANLVKRRLSEAATHAADGGIARAQLDYAGAIAAYERAAALNERVSGETLPESAREDAVWLLASISDLHVTLGDMDGALDAVTRMERAARRHMEIDPGSIAAERNLAVSLIRTGNVRLATGDIAGALQVYEAGHDALQAQAQARPDDLDRQRDVSVSYNKIGDIRLLLGDVAGALEMFERSLSIAGNLVDKEPDDRLWQRDLGISYKKVGDTRVKKGDLAAARRDYNSALDIMTAVAAAHPGETEAQRDLAVALLDVGDIALELGDRAQAGDAFGRSMEIRERLAAADPDRIESLIDLSVAQERIGELRLNQGDTEAALAAFRASHDRIAPVSARHPSNTALRRFTFVSASRIGDILRTSGDLAAALESYRSANRAIAALTTLDPANIEWARDHGSSDERIGLALAQGGDLAGALAAYQASYDRIAPFAARNPDNKALRHSIAVTLVNLGEIKESLGDLDAATADYQQTDALLSALVGGGEPNPKWVHDLAGAREHLANMHAARGDADTALGLYEQARQLRDGLIRLDGTNLEWRREMSVNRNRVGDVLIGRDKLDAAMEAYSEAGRIARDLVARSPNISHWQHDLSVAEEKIGDVLLRQGSSADAMKHFQESLAIRRALAGRDPHNTRWQRDMGVSLERVGDLSRAAGDFSAAQDAHDERLAIARRLAGHDPRNALWQTDLSIALYKSAEIRIDLNQAEPALQLLVPAMQRTRDRLAANPGDSGLIEEARLFLDLLVAARAMAGDTSRLAAEAAEAVDIAARQLALDPAGAEARWNLFVRLWRAADAGVDPAGNLTRGLAILTDLRASGQMKAEADQWIGETEKRIAALTKQ